MTEPSRAISVLRDDGSYIQYKDCPERLIRFTKSAGEGLAALIEHQEVEIKRLKDANAVFTGAGLRYEDEIAQKDASIRRLRGAIAKQSQQLKDAVTKIACYMQWVNDLQSGMYVNCVYCGHRYGPSDKTPVSMADMLKEHIERCPEHPMSKLKADNERLSQKVSKVTRELDAAKRTINLLALRSCGNCRHNDPDTICGRNCTIENGMEAWELRRVCAENGGTQND